MERSVVAACLPRLPSLASLTLDPRLLDNLLFNNLLQSLVEHFKFDHILDSDCLPLEPSFRARPRETGRVLLMDGPLRLQTGSADDDRWANGLVDLLEEHQIVSRSIHLFITTFGFHSHLLLHRQLDAFEAVQITVSSSHALALARWLADVFDMDAFPFILTLSVEVRPIVPPDEDDDDDGFLLTAQTWIPSPRLSGMAPASHEEDFLDEWRWVAIQSYNLETRLGEIHSLEVQFASDSTLDPSALVSLAQHLPTLTSLDISYVGAQIQWSDWVSCFSLSPRLRFQT